MSRIPEIPNTVPEGDLMYVPGFLHAEEAQTMFETLLKDTTWRQDQITVFGRTYDQPRLTALYGEKEYAYSGIKMKGLPFTPDLYGLKQRIETRCKSIFNVCLLNLYRDGQDSNGWHADDERELGQNPVIASLSLGATRSFHLKHRELRGERYQIPLVSGSLLIMRGKTQHHWLHQIPKTKKPVGARINLTFRYIQ